MLSAKPGLRHKGVCSNLLYNIRDAEIRGGSIVRKQGGQVSRAKNACASAVNQKTHLNGDKAILPHRMRKRITLLLATLVLVICWTSSGSESETRDPLVWPFSTESIWNTPIGSNAVYTPANIGPAHWCGGDEDYFFIVGDNDPVRDIYQPKSWRERAGGTLPRGTMRIPDDLIVSDADPPHTANNCAAFLMPNGRTLIQLGALCRVEVGGPVYGYRYADQDIYGEGILGAHGGSGLSCIGGTIRKGESAGSESIRHALKLEVWAKKYLYYSASVPGYRWPAGRADSYASEVYGGTNPKLVQGALLAILPNVTESDLELQTAVGKKIFHALQDYGGYISDDTAWDAHAICIEKGLENWGEGYSGPLYDDINKLFQALWIVDNNGSDNIGGGGTPRAPLAPPLDAPSVTIPY